MLKYLFEPIPRFSLTVFRVLYGVYLFLYFARYAARVDLVFSNNGLYTPYLIPDIAPPLPLAWLVYLFTLIVILVFTFGYRARLAARTLFALYFYHYLLYFASLDTSYDRLNLIFLFLLCLARWDGDRVCPWPQRMIALQVAFLYFGSGVWKLMNPIWHQGEILFWNFTGPWGTPLAFGIAGLGLPMGMYQALAWGIIVWELSMPFMLFSKRTQKFAFLTGLIFHAGNSVILRIPEFALCVATYALFVDPDQMRRWLQKNTR